MTAPRNQWLRLAIFVICLLTIGTRASAEDGNWSFTVAPYAWMSGISGSVATVPPLPPGEVDESFSDILDDLEGAFLIYGEARKDRLFFMTDIVYTDVSASDSFGSGGFATVDVDQENFLIAGAAGYSVIEEPEYRLDLYGGLRYWSIDSTLTLAGPANRRSISYSEDWLDPIAGARLGVPLGENWHFQFTSGIGGFGIGADLEWELFSTVRYQLSDWAWVGFGFRYLSVDYESGGFLYDVDQYGPVLGAAFRF
ncbi:MAG: hypothetical protein P8X75_11780 [Limibacillus sp.]